VNLFTHDLNIYPKTSYTIYQDVLKNRLFKTSKAFGLAILMNLGFLSVKVVAQISSKKKNLESL
jgi:hypothetical protein